MTQFVYMGHREIDRERFMAPIMESLHAAEQGDFFVGAIHPNPKEVPKGVNDIKKAVNMQNQIRAMAEEAVAKFEAADAMRIVQGVTFIKGEPVEVEEKVHDKQGFKVESPLHLKLRMSPNFDVAGEFEARLDGMQWKQAVSIIDGEDDVEMVKAWLEHAQSGDKSAKQPPRVIEAMEARIKALSEPEGG